MNISNRKLHKHIKPVIQKKLDMTHIVIDNELQSMEDKKMGNREQRIGQYFLRIMPNLCGTPVIVRQVIRRKRVSGHIYRDGHVSGWDDGKIQVHLLFLYHPGASLH